MPASAAAAEAALRWGQSGQSLQLGPAPPSGLPGHTSEAVGTLGTPGSWVESEKRLKSVLLLLIGLYATLEKNWENRKMHSYLKKKRKEERETKTGNKDRE